ncbi:MAG: type IV pili twitching motility protein PilT, partial [Dehalococcoidales bacterium]
MSNINVIELLYIAKERRASDLHLVASSPALFRIDGALVPANGTQPLDPEDIEKAFIELTTENDRNYFKEHQELDFAYSMPGAGYFRCNAARQRGAISLAI